ncbi:hypothetical protein A5831_002285 [Enterococcus faecium]|nr:hypothetical protein [Enterococcus faecium]OTO44257.1 hypothetical protein A5831_002285 [Enterococcus faecium]
MHTYTIKNALEVSYTHLDVYKKYQLFNTKSDGGVGIASLVPSYHLHFFGEISTGFQLHRFDQRSNGFGLTAGRNDEILTRWNLEKILTNRVRGIDSNPNES